jgi:hypothetical protein
MNRLEKAIEALQIAKEEGFASDPTVWCEHRSGCMNCCGCDEFEKFSTLTEEVLSSS